MSNIDFDKYIYKKQYEFYNFFLFMRFIILE